MSQKVLLEGVVDEQGELRIEISVLDAALLGKRASLKVQRHYKVLVKSGVDAHAEVLQQNLQLDRSSFSVPVSLPRDFYHYQGSTLSMALEATLSIDDGVLFDTSVTQQLAFPELPPRDETHAGDGSWIQPPDRFSLLTNLSAIPPRNRMIAIGLLIVAVPILLINVAIGVRDEFVPESQAIFYDQSGSDGGESPIMKALTGSGVLGLGVWAALMAQLRRYMRFEIAQAPQRAGRHDRIPARDLIHGRARVPLQDIEIRVVAANVELGQETRRSKKETKTVNIKKHVRATVVYSQKIAYLAADAPIEAYLYGELDMQRLYDTLYPPHRAQPHHGIALEWEVQLLHPTLVDQEVALPAECLQAADFWTPGAGGSPDSVDADRASD